MDPKKKSAAATAVLRTDDPINPEDLKNPLVADFLLGELPERMVEVNGHPMAAPPPDDARAPAVLSREHLVDQILARLRQGYLKSPATLAPALAEAIELAFLQNDVDREAVRVNLPYNAAQVRLGGFSMLHTLTSVADAKVMKVDAPALGKELATVERVRQLRAVIEPAFQILEANETRALASVAGRVDKGLELGWSTIQNNGELLRPLQPALAIRGVPVQAGQQTRADNERRDELVRGDERSRLAELTAQDPARPQMTTTVTTAAPAPTMPSPRIAPGAGKKPGA